MKIHRIASWMIFFAGINASAQVSASSVLEFYNTNLDHYFITADANEAAQIDKGSAGPGWIRTGNNFLSGGNTPVCRFYGSQNPGPNSHFYTVDAGECGYWKQQQVLTPSTQKRWNFESLDFLTTAPANNGNCPINTIPIYRAYNNGWVRGMDSNHRYAVTFAAIQEVLNRGWNYEGVAMCAPDPVTPPPAKTCEAPQVLDTVTNTCFYPMSVKLTTFKPLSASSIFIGDAAWKTAINDGTITKVDSNIVLKGFNDTRKLTWNLFTRNNGTLYCGTPTYKDDGSAIGSWTTPEAICKTDSFDWVISTDEGLVRHSPVDNKCYRWTWNQSALVFNDPLVPCP